MDTRRLIPFLRARFRLDWQGIHGSPHWARVRENGLRLAARTGADERVVELFAFLHDSCRESDGGDPRHGRRSAALARELRGELFELDDAALELLCEACAEHSRGRTRADPTVMTCWDADRLDLGRVGIRPSRRYLCTSAAQDRQLIAWAYERSRGRDPRGSRGRKGRRRR